MNSDLAAFGSHQFNSEFSFQFLLHFPAQLWYQKFLLANGNLLLNKSHFARRPKKYASFSPPELRLNECFYCVIQKP